MLTEVITLLLKRSLPIKWRPILTVGRLDISLRFMYTEATESLYRQQKPYMRRRLQCYHRQSTTFVNSITCEQNTLIYDTQFTGSTLRSDFVRGLLSVRYSILIFILCTLTLTPQPFFLSLTAWSISPVLLQGGWWGWWGLRSGRLLRFQKLDTAKCPQVR